jgi:HSP20 family protein
LSFCGKVFFNYSVFLGISREYRIGRCYRQFSLSDTIDQSKTEAVLKEVVLRLTLPKVEAATPRKINVKAGQ